MNDWEAMAFVAGLMASGIGGFVIGRSTNRRRKRCSVELADDYPTDVDRWIDDARRGLWL